MTDPIAEDVSSFFNHLNIRPRRLRKSEQIRSLIQENQLSISHFIYPIFISEEGTSRYSIPSLPGIERIPLQELDTEMHELNKLGLHKIMLFPAIHQSKKNNSGSESYNDNGLIQRAVKNIKALYPNMVLFADVALDPYTSHGHDGILDEKGIEILNDETVETLCRQSLSLAKAGVDFVCPSDMMDGRIGAIRKTLDNHKWTQTGILAYSAKYASSFYGPFRQAVDSGSKTLDKKTYQLNPANTREALREALLDEEEGADMIMVKPGLPYLDILHQVKQQSKVPVVVYQVSGEYAMIKFAAAQNVLDEKLAILESLLSLKRAGADVIISYFAKWAAQTKLIS